MLTLRLNVKHSTFAQLMELEVWPSTASSVLMVQSSTRTTSSVTGGSTLTVLKLKVSTPSMMTLPLKELRSTLLPVTSLPMELLLMSMPLLLLCMMTTPPKLKLL